jgi:ArsR family transcriptional regulator
MTTRPNILDHAATLAEMTRCRILRLLDHHELTVSELCGALRLPQSTASRHLKVLLDGGWVEARREGTSHLYRMTNGSLAQSARQMWSLVREELEETDDAELDRQRLDDVLRARRSRSQDFFSQGAAGWDRLRDELFGKRFDLLALVGLFDPRWVVGDLGCGTGRLSEALAPWVEQVIAVDGSAAMLAAARARLERFNNIKLRQGELERLPIDDHQIDAATLFLALHHLPEPDKVLAEARRVLKKNGRLLLVDMLPHDREEYRQEMGHVWLGFSEDQLRRLLSRAGFSTVRFAPLPADTEARGPELFTACATP